MRLEARFISSAPSLRECPRWNRVEIALAGRSNVGKSSLLNAVTGVKNLARTSKMPGRTRMLNFFAVGERLALVDLPGYGYARMSQTDAARIAELMRDYLVNRENLGALVMLIDARRGPGREELDLAALLKERGVELVAAATKCDKLRSAERSTAVRRFDILGGAPLMCSAFDGEGIDELRRRILKCAQRAHPATCLST